MNFIQIIVRLTVVAAAATAPARGGGVSTVRLQGGAGSERFGEARAQGYRGSGARHGSHGIRYFKYLFVYVRRQDRGAFCLSSLFRMGQGFEGEFRSVLVTKQRAAATWPRSMSHLAMVHYSIVNLCFACTLICIFNKCLLLFISMCFNKSTSCYVLGTH